MRRVARLKESYPTAKVQLWCEDEHRLGLKPIVVRKAWRAPSARGRRLRSTSDTSGDLPLRLRAPEERRSALAHPTHRERGGFLDGFGELR